MWIYVVFFGVTVICYLYNLIIKPLSYWKHKGISYEKPLPLIGSYGEFLLKRKHISEIQTNIYKKHSTKRYVGFYQFTKPTLLIRDLDLIKKITVEDFEHFIDHMGLVDKDPDPIMNNMLFSMKGNKWKQMRATLSPIFTSAKIKQMSVFMKECAENFEISIPKDKGTIEYNMRDIFSKFANDVIASTAFGVKCNSIKDNENEFYNMARKITNFSGLQNIIIFFQNLFPKLTKILNITILDKKQTKYFKHIINESLSQRESQNIVRPDLIHFLNQAKKGKLVHESNKNDDDTGFATVQESKIGMSPNNIKTQWTDDEITAQGLIFFLAGFDGISISSSFMAYELAVNKEVQEKLQKEIDSVFSNTNGVIKYEDIIKMKYLDQVISETLRKWTPGFQSDRLCVKDYTIPAMSSDEKDITLEAGTTVVIPIMAIHRNPDYYPNPDRFNPDRFNEENKSSIIPGSYLPFSVGPRNCIGSRFALIQLKILFTYLLHKYNIVPTLKTVIPFKLNPKKFNFNPDPLYLGFEPRNINCYK